MRYIKKPKHSFQALLVGIAAGLGLLMTACADDTLGVNGSVDEGSRTEVMIQLDVDVPLGDYRTRAADDLGTTDVNTLWVGVYDTTTGNRVGSKFFSAPSGSVTLPVIYYDAHPTVAIVGVANYDGATNNVNESLESLLEGAETWNALVDIDVATGAEIDPGKRQVMMGLLSSEGQRAFFKTSANGAVSIDNNTTWKVTLTSSQYGAMIKEIRGKSIYLNRLYSQVNVNVTAGENAEVTNISYRRGNMPTATYLAERPTYNGTVKTWDTFRDGTPNFADKQMTPSNGLISKAPCYVSDEKTAWRSAGNGNSFTFCHLDNKHWRTPDDGMNDAALEGHSNREAFKDEEILKGLGHPYNNYASYFVVKMTILDKKKNQSAEVEYTIHEGYINDPNGNAVASAVKNGDYSAFRNTIYNYNIQVDGINYISYNVTESNSHHDGASGTIWDTETSTANALKGTITVKADPESVFRFYVARGEDSPLDYISGNTDGMNGVYWPDITNTASGQVPDRVANSFNFSKDGTNLTLAEFILDAKTTGGTYTITFNPENPDKKRINPEAYKLCVYYYNPNEIGSPEQDSDGCTIYTGRKLHIVQWLPSPPEQLKKLTGLPDKSTKRFINNSVALELKDAIEASPNNALTYGVDYQYVLTIGGKDYVLDPVTYPDYKFTIKISELVDTDNYTYTVKAVALNQEEYYDSDAASGNVTLQYPNWDFQSSNWVSKFKGWGGGDGKNYSEFTGQIKENVVDKLSLEASGTKKIRGYYSGNSPYLNLFNSGSTCAIYFTVYQNCNITITGTGGDGRVLKVDGATPDAQDVPGTFTYKGKIELQEGEGSRVIRIYSGSQSMSFKKIELTVLK